MNEELTVLVVEDNPADLDIVLEMLSETGPVRFKVESASRLSGALDRLEGGGIDVVLLDLGLPDSQGLDTLRAVANAAPHVPIVVFTGHDDEETGQAAAREGAQDYLVKGLIPERMFARVVRFAVERKRADESLRKSELKYRELVEHANSIILHWTRDGQITFLNEFGQRFFGYSEGEIFGQHVVGTIVPETESTGRDLRPLMAQICADPLAFVQNVNENMRRNGDRVWIAWTNKIDFDDQGRVVGILSIGEDITERKRAEKKLQDQNRFLQILIDAIPLSIFYKGTDGIYAGCNKSYAQFLGLSKEEIIGKGVYDIFPKDIAVIYYQRDAALFHKPGIQQYEAKMNHADGTIHDVLFTKATYEDEDDGVAGLIGAMLDITERKRAEAEREAADGGHRTGRRDHRHHRCRGDHPVRQPGLRDGRPATPARRPSGRTRASSRAASRTRRSTASCGKPSPAAGPGRAAWSTSARTGRSTPRRPRFRRCATLRAGSSTTWPSSATSPSICNWRSNFSRPRRWNRWAGWPAAWPTISTTCWASSSAMRNWPYASRSTGTAAP